MDKKLYKMEIKATVDPSSDTVVMIATQIHGPVMLHHLTKREWELIEDILDALAQPPSPVPYIIHEVSGYSEEGAYE